MWHTASPESSCIFDSHRYFGVIIAFGLPQAKVSTRVGPLGVIASVFDSVVRFVLLLNIVRDRFALVIDKNYFTALVIAYHFIQSLVIVQLPLLQH